MRTTEHRLTAGKVAGESKQIPVFRCPVYLKWIGVKERAGDGAINKRSRAYLDVDVCDDWLSFMNFRRWVLEQPCWEGLALDKDLVVYGNKIYAPEYCAFVPRSINTLIIAGGRSSNTGQPFGVSLTSKSTRAAPHLKYVSHMYKDGEAIKKYTETAEQAHSMWQENREACIRKAVNGWLDYQSYRQDIADNLLAVADKLLYNRLEGVETFDLSF